MVDFTPNYEKWIQEVQAEEDKRKVFSKPKPKSEQKSDPEPKLESKPESESKPKLEFEPFSDETLEAEVSASKVSEKTLNVTDKTHDTKYVPADVRALPLVGLFEPHNGKLIRLPDYKVSSARNVPTSIVRKVQDDLKERYSGVVVYLGDIETVVDDNNRVFTEDASLMRYSVYAQIENPKERIQYAKQMYEADHEGFSKNDKRKASYDIYQLIVATTEGLGMSLNDQMAEVQNDMTAVQNIVTMMKQQQDAGQRESMIHTQAIMQAVTYLLGVNLYLFDGNDDKERLKREINKLDSDVMATLHDMMYKIGVVYQNRSEVFKRNGK